MQSYVISISDAGDGGWQNMAVIPKRAELPHAVQLAVQTLMDTSGDDICFPLFIDIYPASQFEHVAWMHRGRAPHSPVSPSDVLSH